MKRLIFILVIMFVILFGFSTQAMSYELPDALTKLAEQSIREAAQGVGIAPADFGISKNIKLSAEKQKIGYVFEAYTLSDLKAAAKGAKLDSVIANSTKPKYIITGVQDGMPTVSIWIAFHEGSYKFVSYSGLASMYDTAMKRYDEIARTSKQVSNPRIIEVAAHQYLCAQIDGIEKAIPIFFDAELLMQFTKDSGITGSWVPFSEYASYEETRLRPMPNGEILIG